MNNNYLFKIIWSQTTIGIAVNQNSNIPLTNFYFWPSENSWILVKEELSSKPWISKDSTIEILNGYTKLINYWKGNIKIRISKLSRISKDLGLNLEILAANSNKI
jgi:Plastid and cyanobacterial ribosomal protein (PSRP-3 / Ycf65)